MTRVEAIGLTGLPEIAQGAELGPLLVEAWRREVGEAHPTDILVVAHKVVSKSEGCLVRLADVQPSALATLWAEGRDKDPRVIELVLRESRRIVRMDRGVLIVETHHGLICANAGIDTSNVPHGFALTLPRDPDGSARGLRSHLTGALGAPVGVIVSDTFSRPWREGLTDVAIGVAGIRALEDFRGTCDTFGRRLQTSVLAVADEIASAAELAMSKARGVPAVVIRGLDVRGEDGTARDLLRPSSQDLFR